MAVNARIAATECSFMFPPSHNEPQPTSRTGSPIARAATQADTTAQKRNSSGNAIKSVLRAPHLTQSGQKAHQITNVSMPRPELAQHHYLIITKQQIGLLAKLASQVF
ncbi:hypothetical protein HGG76_09865 [Ochrobactrum tritici]|uniref:Uncharacterized protein n=1 Tax=Brucella tritici TaxID=94626 RepID=A0A7X6JCR5_9HYPH|nr:hypothetical protein [Brucella tritici]